MTLEYRQQKSVFKGSKLEIFMGPYPSFPQWDINYIVATCSTEWRDDGTNFQLRPVIYPLAIDNRRGIDSLMTIPELSPLTSMDRALVAFPFVIDFHLKLGRFLHRRD